MVWQTQPRVRSSSEVPEYLRRSAYVVGNGEQLWPLASVLAMVEWLANHQFGIVGGEVYERRAFGWGRYIRDWATAPSLSATEPWPSYVARAKRQATEAVLRDARNNEA